jgi:hypothetical protein
LARKLEKNWRCFPQNTYAELIITLGFKNNANVFAEKLPKIVIKTSAPWSDVMISKNIFARKLEKI